MDISLKNVNIFPLENCYGNVVLSISTTKYHNDIDIMIIVNLEQSIAICINIISMA